MLKAAEGSQRVTKYSVVKDVGHEGYSYMPLAGKWNAGLLERERPSRGGEVSKPP